MLLTTNGLWRGIQEFLEIWIAALDLILKMLKLRTKIVILLLNQ